MKEVILYTDGACSFNPGPGGWGCVLICGEEMKEMSGACEDTTNNRMELQAVISGLSALTQQCKVDIYTDSAYVCNAFQQKWIGNWVRNNWVNSKDEPVANKDLWKKLLAECEKHEIAWHKVKGHADNQLNNRCDELARLEIEKIFEQNPNIMEELQVKRAAEEAKKVSQMTVVATKPADGKTVEELAKLAKDAAEKALEYIKQIEKIIKASDN